LAAAALAVAVGFGCAGDDDGGDREAFCALATQRGEASLLDPDVTQQELDRLGLVYEELAEAAPGEVGDAADLANDAVQRLRAGDVSFIADEEQAARLIAALDAIGDYVRDECP
jgi:hypothetical protein